MDAEEPISAGRACPVCAAAVTRPMGATLKCREHRGPCSPKPVVVVRHTAVTRVARRPQLVAPPRARTNRAAPPGSNKSIPSPPASKSDYGPPPDTLSAARSCHPISPRRHYVLSGFAGRASLSLRYWLGSHRTLLPIARWTRHPTQSWNGTEASR